MAKDYDRRIKGFSKKDYDLVVPRSRGVSSDKRFPLGRIKGKRIMYGQDIRKDY